MQMTEIRDFPYKEVSEEAREGKAEGERGGEG